MNFNYSKTVISISDEYSSKTTEIYTHVAVNSIKNIKNGLD